MRPISFSRKIPPDDNVEREVCNSCNFIHYINPKVVVGSVVTFEGRFLLCKRAIEPRLGFWTLPAGYLEEKETTQAGATREAFEEANAQIHIRDLLAVYSLPSISQVQLIYRAELHQPEFSAGHESLAVDLFSWEDIPWDSLAFPSVRWALKQFREVEHKDSIVPFSTPQLA